MQLIHTTMNQMNLIFDPTETNLIQTFYLTHQFLRWGIRNNSIIKVYIFVIFEHTLY